jgi:hypothetical protein
MKNDIINIDYTDGTDIEVDAMKFLRKGSIFYHF